MPKSGTKQAKRLKPGTVALVCDKCAALITGDDGYLTVQNKRWRMYHDGCHSRTEAVVVRSSRVSTYSLLLTTLATLAADPRTGFADTAWPALLQRLAFDTDWVQTDGLKTQKQLATEHREMIDAAGFNRYMQSDGEVALELIRKKNAYEYDKREREASVSENAGQRRTSIGEGNSR